MLNRELLVRLLLFTLWHVAGVVLRLGRNQVTHLLDRLILGVSKLELVSLLLDIGVLVCGLSLVDMSSHSHRLVVLVWGLGLCPVGL